MCDPAFLVQRNNSLATSLERRRFRTNRTQIQPSASGLFFEHKLLFCADTQTDDLATNLFEEFNWFNTTVLAKVTTWLQTG
jgi:hypothetical protein